jgi:P27 family predicted phage terminase small subunit
MGGRRPKPTALLELQKGKLYSDQRDRAELEPHPEFELLPLCPARFTKEEKAAWKYHADVLKNYGLLSVANAAELELLAAAWAQYVAISSKIRTSTLAAKIMLNDQKVERLFKKQHQLADRIDKYLQNLGLSSSAMAKMGSLMLKAKKKRNEMEDLLD